LSGELLTADISDLANDDLPPIDFLAGGFPCQPFSIAGYQEGFKDKGRGDLFFDIVKILKKSKPKSFLLENVKNLNTHNKGKTLEIIYKELEGVGYHVKSKVMNATEYGNLPQNRERIYIVGFLSELSCKRFEFPKKIKLTKTVIDCLETGYVDDKFYYNDKPLYPKLVSDITKRNTVYQWRRKYVRENKRGVCPTLTANMGTGGHNVPLILDGKGIRKLTPRECANFQGFPSAYVLPEIAVSHLYKQIGNSVAIPVVERIGKKILQVL